MKRFEVLNPHGSDETHQYCLQYLYCQVLNPHGSDETVLSLVKCPQGHSFLTHTVQMKRGSKNVSRPRRRKFLTHTVQMKLQQWNWIASGDPKFLTHTVQMKPFLMIVSIVAVCGS